MGRRTRCASFPFNTWPLIPLALLVAGCAGFTVAEQARPALRNDRHVCNMSTTADPVGWESESGRYGSYVAEARRRGLSLQACMRLLARDTVVAARTDPSAHSDRKICTQALTGWARGRLATPAGARWTKPSAAALRRGAVRKILGRVARSAPASEPSQTAEKAPAPRASAQVSRDTTRPVIAVPATLGTSTGEYEIAGRVIDESEIAELRFEGKAVPVSRSGDFRISAYAPPGRREIEAIDVWNNRATKTIVVTRTVADEPALASFVSLNPLKVTAATNPNAIAIIVGLENYENAQRELCRSRRPVLRRRRKGRLWGPRRQHQALGERGRPHDQREVGAQALASRRR